MRSTQKKGPRTRAVKLMHAARSGSPSMRTKLALAAAQMLPVQASAGLAAVTIAQVINAMWSNAQRREPPEPEPAIQIAPKKPLAPESGSARPTPKTGIRVSESGWSQPMVAEGRPGLFAALRGSDEPAALRSRMARVWSLFRRGQKS